MWGGEEGAWRERGKAPLGQVIHIEQIIDQPEVRQPRPRLRHRGLNRGTRGKLIVTRWRTCYKTGTELLCSELNIHDLSHIAMSSSVTVLLLNV